MDVRNEGFVKVLLLVLIGFMFVMFVHSIYSNQNSVSSEYDESKIIYEHLIDKGLSRDAAVAFVGSFNFDEGYSDVNENDILDSFRVTRK